MGIYVFPPYGRLAMITYPKKEVKKNNPVEFQGVRASLF
jgi:hypothetical protein